MFSDKKDDELREDYVEKNVIDPYIDLKTIWDYIYTVDRELESIERDIKKIKKGL